MRVWNISFPVCLILLPLSAAPSMIEGLVTDPSGAAIAGARVECEGRTASTEPDGRFRLSGVARCAAQISAPGFETKQVELVAAVPARIQLALAALSQRVVVSAARRPTTVEEAGVAGEVLTRTDLALRQFPPLAEPLRELAGLHLVRYGRLGSLTQVFTRGGQRTGTLVLLDGVPLNDPGGELNLAAWDTAFLERVEVVRSPESALFGAEASSGVIQLFTRRGDPERRLPHGSLAYERGAFATDRWMAALAGGAPGWDYSLGAQQFHTAGEYPNDFFRHTSGVAALGWSISQTTQARALWRGSDAATGTPNQVGYGIINYDARQLSRDWLAAVRLDDLRSPHYAQRFGFGYHRLRDLYIDNGVGGPYTVAALVRDVAQPVPRVYLVRLVDPNLPPEQIPPGARLVRRSVAFFPSDPYRWLASRTDAEYQGNLTAGGGAMVFGYEYERQSGEVTGRQVARHNHGVFVHHQHNLAGRIALSGGLRLEHSSAFGSKVAPRGAVSFRLGGERGALDETFLRVSAGRGITEPSLIANYARDPWFVGNLALRPEKTAAFEAGLVQAWFRHKLRTEVSVFDNYFRDLIVFVFLPYPEPSTWRNVEAARARGLELSAQARLKSWLALSGQYTRLRTRITASGSPDSPFTGIGQELARRPGNSGAVTLSLTPRGIWLQTGAVLMGERQDNDLFGVTRNPGYQNVYAALTLRSLGRLVPYLRVENLLNARYHEVLGYSNLSRAVTGGLRIEW